MDEVTRFILRVIGIMFGTMSLFALYDFYIKPKKELLHSEKSVPVSESVSDESLSGISGSQVNTCLSEKCERCQIYEKVINDIYNHLQEVDE